MPRQPVVHRQLPNGTPAVHALVIGVGRYNTAGPPPLNGAADSAIAFAAWLLQKQHAPGLELGSVDILASQASGVPVKWNGHDLDPPSSALVQQAVDAWHDRAAAMRENLAVFYFCGHGVEVGALESLLLGDVDLTCQDPFANALAFDDFIRGMDSCGARKQLFVIDACRELPPGYGAWDDAVGLGRPMVRFNLKRRAAMRPRLHAVLQATSSTQKAWPGRQQGWFTEALLLVLDGAAGNNRYAASVNEFPVNTREIVPTIELLMQREFIPPPVGDQQPVRRGEGDFDLHLPDPPQVPVLVTHEPAALNQGRQMSAKRAGVEVANYTWTDARPWQSTLAVGVYEFCSESGVHREEIVVPARKVVLQ